VSWALTLKELREHRWVVLVSWALFLLGIAADAFRGRDVGSPFHAFHEIGPATVTVLALICANRLVVREYGSRTQLFLEALPLTRSRVLFTKWAVGVLWLAVPLLLGLSGLWLAGRSHAEIAPKLVAAMAARAMGFAVCWYSLTFLVGLLGRYRFIVWTALLFGLYLLDEHAQLGPKALAPLRLVQPEMLLETTPFPFAELGWTALATAVLLATAALVALRGEGVWVTALSHRMSYREKVGFAVALLIPLFVLQVLDHRQKKPAFNLADAVRSTDRELVVGVARPPELDEAQARALGDTLAKDLGSMAQWLRLESLPAVFVLPDASIDGDLFLRAELPAADGVVLKGALGSARFDELGFRAFAVHELLVWYTRGRANREDRRWLLDGFAMWWVARTNDQASALLDTRARAAGPVSGAQLARWLESRERLGDCLADAVAFEVMRELARASPVEAQALVRETLGVRPPDDLRGWLHERTLAEQLEQRLSLTFDALAARIQTGAAAGPASEALRFTTNRLKGDQYEVRFEPLAAGGSFAVRWQTLGPWSAELERETMGRVDARGAGVLPFTMPRGAKLFVAAEQFDERLECTRRFAAERREMR
jgi:hypothetical protein